MSGQTLLRMQNKYWIFFFSREVQFFGLQRGPWSQWGLLWQPASPVSSIFSCNPVSPLFHFLQQLQLKMFLVSIFHLPSHLPTCTISSTISHVEYWSMHHVCKTWCIKVTNHHHHHLLQLKCPPHANGLFFTLSALPWGKRPIRGLWNGPKFSSQLEPASTVLWFYGFSNLPSKWSPILSVLI